MMYVRVVGSMELTIMLRVLETVYKKRRKKVEREETNVKIIYHSAFYHDGSHHDAADGIC